MSFQKCPKCNASGLIEDDDRFSSAHWKQCPLCLGEFVIHEEQGVPPSKIVRNANPMLQFENEMSQCPKLPESSTNRLYYPEGRKPGDSEFYTSKGEEPV